MLIEFGKFSGRRVDQLTDEQARSLAAGIIGGPHEGSPIHLAICKRGGFDYRPGPRRRSQALEEKTPDELPLSAQIALAVFPVVTWLHCRTTGPADVSWGEVGDECFEVADLFLRYIEARAEE